MQDDGSFDSSILKAFQNKVSDWMLLHACHALECIKTNLVFWIRLVVACGFMGSLNGVTVNNFRKPSIFSGGSVL